MLTILLNLRHPALKFFIWNRVPLSQLQRQSLVCIYEVDSFSEFFHFFTQLTVFSDDLIDLVWICELIFGDLAVLLERMSRSDVF